MTGYRFPSKFLWAADGKSEFSWGGFSQKVGIVLVKVNNEWARCLIAENQVTSD